MFENTVTLPPALRRKPQNTYQRNKIVPSGFAAGTYIRTITGPRRIETLFAGDLLLDVDDQIVEIRSIRKFTLHKDDVVKVEPSALGLGMPPDQLSHELIVARGQKLAIQDWRSHVLFGKPVLSSADTLVDGVHIRKVAVSDMQLCAVCFDTPTVIQANGIHALASV
ncbi:Hint domain-containing protein [Roseinatronobacter sp. S2]|uniref:Hint domain-containing protein n=1 Tax=Roseinatronobacter sp. S2 TaxID=3035471 RepID=UPI00240FBB21|nr:Hint domain-containing protein [Roseinatronobacter sp. S2]WFE74032.1 Hint domain-containing protein [Roseinatronobacter sp. S2]